MITSGQLVRHLIESDYDLDASRYFDDMVSGWQLIDVISKQEWVDFFKSIGYRVTYMAQVGRKSNTRQAGQSLLNFFVKGRAYPNHSEFNRTFQIERAMNDFMRKRLGSEAYVAHIIPAYSTYALPVSIHLNVNGQ